MENLKKKMAFNFHDAVIISSDFHGNNWTIKLRLCEILYPGKKDLKLIFKNIHRTEKALNLHHEMVADELEPGWNGTRINDLDFDSKKILQETSQHYYMNADGYKPVSISCTDLEIKAI